MEELGKRTVPAMWTGMGNEEAKVFTKETRRHRATKHWGADPHHEGFTARHDVMAFEEREEKE